MIITLRGCTATAFIGGLNFFKVSKGTVSGADVTISTSTINKDAATSTSAREIATVALKSNYENLVVTVTMGGATVNWYANGKVTIPANTTVTGDIKISASATAVSGGEVVDPEEPSTGVPGSVFNFANATSWQHNKYIKETTGEYGGGAAQGQSGWGTYIACEDYIPIEGGKTYCITLDGKTVNSRFWAWYTSNASDNSGFISGDNIRKDNFTAPENATYCRVTLIGPWCGYAVGEAVVENNKLISPDPSRLDIVVVES